MGNKSVVVKVSGTPEDVAEFLRCLDAQFSVMMKSKLLPNKGEEGVHCFVDLNPYIRSEQQ